MRNLDEGVLLHDRYRILNPLGKGGMGMVYLAEDISLNHQVAVKENYALGEDGTEQFLQEARLLAALHHPNLPRVTDYFVEGPFQYFVMDFIPGDDLQVLLEREGRQPFLKVIQWMGQLVEGLAYMHNQSPPITHRDIKPANIRLRKDGSAVLVDFGIAKAAESAQKTNAGASGYTPGFAPPEQAGGGRTGPYSDQYALAATIYTLLTGTRPVESIKRVLEGEKLGDARELNAEISQNISTALNKAMALQPENRFADVHEFFDALINPDFNWSEIQIDRNTQPTGRKMQPAWMVAAYTLIGLLVVAILAVSAIAVFELLKPDVQVSQTVPSIALSAPPTLSVNPSVEITTEASGEVSQNPTTIAPTEFIAAATEMPTNPLISEGKWLAYSSDQADGSTLQIWLLRVGLDNSGRPVEMFNKQLTDTPGDKTSLTWSPDGKTILFSAPSLNISNGLDIWRLPLEGSTAEDISNRKGDDLYASWSPDGRRIVFSNNGRDDGVVQLFLMDSDGSNQHRISTDYEESQGIWQPDTQNLLYVIRASNNQYLYQRGEEGEYKTPQPYDNHEVFGRLGQVTDPAFSPDGSLFAYTRSKGNQRNISVANYSSRGAIFTVVTNTGKDFDPAWSSDGKWIAFTSERDDNPEIYVMSAAGLIQTNVSQSPGREIFPAWQP